MRLTALVVLAALGAAPVARADGPLDPTDEKWNDHARGEPGRMTVQGDQPPETQLPPPPISFWVSMPLTLAADIAGFVLVVPQLSIDHVLGYRDGANKQLGYAGLGVLTLAPALGMGLSGGSIGTMVVAPLIEAALIGLAFGSAYLSYLALNSTSNALGQFAVDDLIGIPLVTVAVPLIAAAALFPVICAFVPGNSLDQEDQRELRPLDSIGIIPVRGGGILSASFKLF